MEAPRNKANRYRVYVLRDGKPELVATAGNPSALGRKLVDMANERWQRDNLGHEPHGVLDCIAGRWVCGLWLRQSEVEALRDLTDKEEV